MDLRSLVDSLLPESPAEDFLRPPNLGVLEGETALSSFSGDESSLASFRAWFLGLGDSAPGASEVARFSAAPTVDARDAREPSQL